MNFWQEIKFEYHASQLRKKYQRWKKRKEYLKNLKIKYENRELKK